jgi:hypothetical protein
MYNIARNPLKKCDRWGRTESRSIYFFLAVSLLAEGVVASHLVLFLKGGAHLKIDPLSKGLYTTKKINLTKRHVSLQTNSTFSFQIEMFYGFILRKQDASL